MISRKSSKNAQPRKATAMKVSPDELKATFGPQKIPLSTDFADIIEMADKGCRAVGLAKGQDGEPGAGLKRSEDDKVSVDASALAGGGLTVQGDGKLIIGIAGGLRRGENDLSVDTTDMAGEGLTGLGKTLAVKLNTVDPKTNGGTTHEPGLLKNNNGLSVNPGKGIFLDHFGLSVKTTPKSGLEVDEENGLRVVTSLTNPGLECMSDGVGFSDKAYISIMAKLYGAQFYVEIMQVVAFVVNAGNRKKCAVHFFARNGVVSMTNGLSLNGKQPHATTTHGAQGFWVQTGISSAEFQGEALEGMTLEITLIQSDEQMIGTRSGRVVRVP